MTQLDPSHPAAPYWSIVQQQAATHALDPYLLAAMIMVETGRTANPKAYNKSSMASGLLQVIPQEYARGNRNHWAWQRPPSAELMQPETGIRWGALVLAEFRRQESGAIKRAVWRYSGGTVWPSFQEFGERYWSKVLHEYKAAKGAPFMNIIEKPSKHGSDRDGRTVEYIIVHDTVSPDNVSLERTAAYLVKNERKVSAHELVGPDTVYLLLPDNKASHHAGATTSRLPNGAMGAEVNLRTWGIEAYMMVSQKTMDEDTYKLLLTRVIDACQRFGLPASKVLAHREIDPTRRKDPRSVDMEVFRKAVDTALAKEVGGLRFDKLAWAQEQAARLLQGEGFQTEHDFIMQSPFYKQITEQRDAA